MSKILVCLTILLLSATAVLGAEFMGVKGESNGVEAGRGLNSKESAYASQGLNACYNNFRSAS